MSQQGRFGPLWCPCPGPYDPLAHKAEGPGAVLLQTPASHPCAWLVSSVPRGWGLSPSECSHPSPRCGPNATSKGSASGTHLEEPTPSRQPAPIARPAGPRGAALCMTRRHSACRQGEPDGARNQGPTPSCKTTAGERPARVPPTMSSALTPTELRAGRLPWGTPTSHRALSNTGRRKKTAASLRDQSQGQCIHPRTLSDRARVQTRAPQRAGGLLGVAVHTHVPERTASGRSDGEARSPTPGGKQAEQGLRNLGETPGDRAQGPPIQLARPPALGRSPQGWATIWPLHLALLCTTPPALAEKDHTLSPGCLPLPCLGAPARCTCASSSSVSPDIWARCGQRLGLPDGDWGLRTCLHMAPRVPRCEGTWSARPSRAWAVRRLEIGKVEVPVRNGRNHTPNHQRGGGAGGAKLLPWSLEGRSSTQHAGAGRRLPREREADSIAI